MFAVTGAWPRPTPARLPNFRPARLRGQAYPGLVPALGAIAQGQLYRHLGAAALARLDAFEGPWYRRCRVIVETAHGRVRAESYALTHRGRRFALASDWSIAEFRATDRLRFARYWRARLRACPPRRRGTARILERRPGDP